MPLELNGPFYTTFRNTHPHFDVDTYVCAQDTVENLIRQATTSDHPGMLLGKVQSGKTRTFISVIALSFDNEYDVAIVLTKNSQPLVEQTYKRLRSELQAFLANGELEVYDIMECPDDFSAFEMESKLIFIAKKETNNIERLQNLLVEKCPELAKKKILIIDDEADSASIGYSRREGLIQANVIAAQISDLRGRLPRSSFLQVTATPYSLYLQPPEIEVANVQYFQPTRPAFTVLAPIGNGYIGGDTYFGESSRAEQDTLESLIHHNVDPRELPRLRAKDRRSYHPEEILTTDLYQGIRTALVLFLVGGTIQRIRGLAEERNPRTLRYSFLFHTETLKGAHAWQVELVEEIISRLRIAALGHDPLFDQLVGEAYADLDRSLVLDGCQVPLLADVIREVRRGLQDGYVTISRVNCDADVSALLDDHGQLKLRSPFSIFIGGQVIDRGVTVANLLVFFYGRRPQRYQQDTVLQHSRMYGYRRADLAVTRFFTAPFIRHAMSQMEEFDSSLRAVIEAGGDRGIQFIRRSATGNITPCSPNKILVARTQTLRPHRRVLPIGFQNGHRTGANGIGAAIEALDREVERLCGFNTEEPSLVTLDTALDLLNRIEPTLRFDDEDAPFFDWDVARGVLCHLSQQHSDEAQRGQVYLWAARNRNSSRMAGATAHATYIETPDTPDTEGQIAQRHAIEHPILFLLRQNGASERGWRGNTPFYWPVIRAQANTPTAVYTAETLD